MSVAASDTARGQGILSPSAFARVAELARREAGLHIAESKHAMVQSRLNRRLRTLGIDSFETYLDLVARRDGTSELREMISVLTTNVSHFFREGHHFETLRDDVLGPLTAQSGPRTRIRLWSAGCSSGQEPYSMAMVAHRAMPDIAARDVRILATDIDPRILETARQGEYPQSALSGLPDADRSAYLAEVPDRPEVMSIVPEIRALVAFRELNLLGHWPMQGPFDAIFCRNVVIYFDEATQAKLWPRFEAMLKPGGWLFLGHSERVTRDSGCHLEPAGVTAYRKPADPAASGPEKTPAGVRKGEAHGA